MSKFARFDAADYLGDAEVAAEYLAACLEDENPAVFLAALADVAKARGMAKVARASGLGRESLYKALAVGAHPRHETILKVLRALGFSVAITPVDRVQPHRRGVRRVAAAAGGRTGGRTSGTRIVARR
jgi:probable addiction module antidote protein